jgi:hypothetical protein
MQLACRRNIEFGSLHAELARSSMAKKPNPKASAVLFNVHYEDGSQNSNRRVPGDLVSAFDADEQIRAFIEDQDRKIAEMSGRARGPIKTIKRVR